MNVRRVLFISYYFPPATVAAARRIYDYLTFIDKTDLECFLLIPDVIDHTYADEPSEAIAGVRTSVAVNIKTRRKNTENPLRPRSKGFNLLKKIIYPDKGIFWIFNAYKKAKSIIKDHSVEVIFSSSPLFSTHIIAFFLKKKYPELRWICEVRDFHHILVTDQGGFIRKALNKALEKRIIGQSDRLVFVTKEMEKAYQQFYPGHKGKSAVIYNGVDPSRWDSCREQDPNKEDPIQITYSGTFYNGLRDPVVFFETIDKLMDNGDFSGNRLKINIAGYLEPELIEKLSKYQSYSCVQYLGPTRPEHISRIYARSRFLWLIVPDTPAHALTIPYKTFEYMATGRHIFAFVPFNSPVYHILAEYGNVTFFDKDIDGNASKMIDRLNTSTVYNQPYPNEVYTRQFQAGQLKEIINNL